MVKNKKGGSGHKRMARKHVSGGSGYQNKVRKIAKPVLLPRGYTREIKNILPK